MDLLHDEEKTFNKKELILLFMKIFEFSYYKDLRILDLFKIPTVNYNGNSEKESENIVF